MPTRPPSRGRALGLRPWTTTSVRIAGVVLLAGLLASVSSFGPSAGGPSEQDGAPGTRQAHAAPGFADIPADSVHGEAVAALSEAGIARGCASDRYCPDRPVTRAQMASFLARALDLPAAGEPDFLDVAAGEVHADAIAAVTDAGITRGCRQGSYCPSRAVTRGQMASFLARALDLPDAGQPGFSDVPLDGTHAPAIAAIADADITNGCSAAAYCPGRPVTRAQMASFLHRGLRARGDPPIPSQDDEEDAESGRPAERFPAEQAPGQLSLPAGPRDRACTGVTVRPNDNAAEIVASHPPGTEFCLAAGVHRLEEPIRPRPRQRFAGMPGAVLSGSTVLTEFDRDGQRWVAEGLQSFYEHGQCAGGDDACRHAEQVHLDGEPLRQVTDRADLGPGRFYADHARNRVVLADDPEGHHVELSVTQNAFTGRQWEHQPKADGVVIRDLVVEQFASQAQQGAISSFRSRDWTVEHVEAHRNHGVGIRVEDGGVIRHSLVHHNGQLGISASGAGVLVEGNEVTSNHTAGFDGGWEAGGMKLTRTQGLVLRGNVVRHNDGPGVWTDIDNVDTLIEGNVIADNTNAGIFHEISYDASIRHNRVARNGLAGNVWAYGAGIQIAHSPNVDVYGNVVEGNFNGITVILQDRGEGAHGPWEPRNVTVRENLVRMDRGFTGAVQDVGDDTLFSERGIRFTGNRYDLEGDEPPFAWENRRMTLDEWQAHGNDRAGLEAQQRARECPRSAPAPPALPRCVPGR